MYLRDFLGEMGAAAGCLIVPVFFWYMGVRAARKGDITKGKAWKITAVGFGLYMLASHFQLFS